jgi:hypothetical protein
MASDPYLLLFNLLEPGWVIGLETQSLGNAKKFSALTGWVNQPLIIIVKVACSSVGYGSHPVRNYLSTPVF